jgi:hypothetical protein
MFCSNCGKEVSKNSKCQNCGFKAKKKRGIMKSLLIAIGFVLVAIYFVGGGIETHVAYDFEEQYNIAKRQGDPMQVCVQAGLVAAAYLQAKDDGNYNKWKAQEKKDCNKAGLGGLYE